MKTIQTYSLHGLINQKISFCFLIFLVLFSLCAHAETYIREYTYRASEADSKLSSRAIALDEVKKRLLEELGTHIYAEVSSYKTGDGEELNIQEINAITAGMTKVDIIKEKWDGKNYFVRAKIIANPDEVAESIQEIRKDKSLIIKLNKTQDELESKRKEIQYLKNEILLIRSNPNKITAKRKYINAVENLDSLYMYEKGLEHARHDEYNDAVILWEKSAELGYALAQETVAYSYGLGRGVKRDMKKAAYWYKEAARRNNRDAQLTLSYLYEYGIGVNMDENKALYWQKRFESNPSDRLITVPVFLQEDINLGYFQMIKKAESFERRERYFDAALWYKKFANVARMNSSDYSGYVRVTDNFLKAAKEGHKIAQYYLSYYYANGIALKSNNKKSVFWFNKASMQNKGTVYLGNDDADLCMYLYSKNISVSPENCYL